MQAFTVPYREYVITSDKQQLQPEAVHRWLSTESYWSKNIPFTTVKNAMDHSYCVGVLYKRQQIGFARMITDYTTFAYLADVYIEAAHRRKGICKVMITMILEQDWAKNLRRIMLATLDAHDLYQQLGFIHTAFPERFMEINRPAVYENAQTAAGKIDT